MEDNNATKLAPTVEDQLKLSLTTPSIFICHLRPYIQLKRRMKLLLKMKYTIDILMPNVRINLYYLDLGVTVDGNDWCIR